MLINAVFVSTDEPVVTKLKKLRVNAADFEEKKLIGTQCAQVFYRTSNTYLFFPIGLSEFFNPIDICWKYNQGWNVCSSCGPFYLRTRNTMYFQKISLNV